MNYFFKILLFLVFCNANIYCAFSQLSKFSNPIIKGGASSPSICKTGEDFYIVNSSFDYFPALPIHHSNDLANWTLIGHGLHKKEQCTGRMNLVDVQSNGGIHVVF